MGSRSERCLDEGVVKEGERTKAPVAEGGGGARKVEGLQVVASRGLSRRRLSRKMRESGCRIYCRQIDEGMSTPCMSRLGIADNSIKPRYEQSNYRNSIKIQKNYKRALIP